MNALAVYAHIPFCVVKCGYCDFNTYAGLDSLKPAYAEALIAEVATWRGVLGASRIASISFGGGTPGEFPPDGLAAVADALLASAGEVAGDIEISLEANPGTTSAHDLAALTAAGFNRISFGAQSFLPAELRFLDRLHSPGATLASIAGARSAGFASIGLDLIYGLPGQPLDDWRASLNAALAAGVDHISCYALTVEEGTPLSRKVARGDIVEADPDRVAELYEAAETTLAGAGFCHYEISNWARAGHASRHNSVYWTGGPYLGLGAGAHGYIDGERIENVAAPAEYIRRFASSPSFRAGVAGSYRPDGARALVDWVEARLRLIDGFALDELASTFEAPIAGAALEFLVEMAPFGLLERVNAHGADHVRLTPRGRLLHLEICARLLARLS